MGRSESFVHTITAGIRTIVVRKDLRVPMRDGVELVADAYHDVADEPRPALVALSPYGKELQALALTMPPQRRPSPLWDGCIEAGDIARVVGEGYVHVIGDVRGSGGSDGEHIGNYNAGGVPIGKDAYDFIEWVAAQPWCNGVVGMIGISYYGSMQVYAAAERPPHLKAIFVSGGHFDFYETTYHGGIMWFMPRAAREGRGGDSGWAFTDRIKSRMLETFSDEEIRSRVTERLSDPDVASWPNLVHILNYPTHHEAWFDIITNQYDGEWYEEQNPIRLATNIDIPVYLQINQGRGWTMDGTIELYDVLRGPKKLEIGPYPPMQSRPWVEEHDTMFRWYEYWLKGVDNGVMDEPAVKVHVEGTKQWATGDHWPIVDVKYRPLYLGTGGRLLAEPAGSAGSSGVPEVETFFQAPLTLTTKVEKLTWASEPFATATTMHGVGAAHLFVAIDQDDTNLILRLWDEASTGKRQLITTGFLKASHNELDDRSSVGNPYHPHTRSAPVVPGAVVEYVIRIYPFANTFIAGNKLVVELMCNEPLADEHNSLLPPDAYHLPVGRPVTHTVYLDAERRSLLLLPFAIARPEVNDDDSALLLTSE
jgi:uncharacterized protein